MNKKQVDQIVWIHLAKDYYVISIKENGTPTIICNDQGNLKTSYAISFLDSEILIGDAAQSASLRNPTNSVENVLELVGYSYGCDHMKNLRHVSKYKITEIDQINVGIEIVPPQKPRVLSVQNLMSLIFNRIFQHVKNYLKFEIYGVGIVVPIDFSAKQTESISKSILFSKFKLSQIIYQEIGALIAYQLYKCIDITSVLIFNYGFQNFSIALYESNLKSNNLICFVKSQEIKGQLVLSKIIQKFADKIKKDTGADVLLNYRACRRLKFQTLKILRFLQTNIQGKVQIDSLIDQYDFSYTITKKQLQQLLQPFCKKSIEMTGQMLVNHKYEAQKINKVIMIGQLCRTSVLQKKMNQFFPQKVCFFMGAQFAVAKGAVFYNTKQQFQQ